MLPLMTSHFDTQYSALYQNVTSLKVDFSNYRFGSSFTLHQRSISEAKNHRRWMSTPFCMSFKSTQKSATSGDSSTFKVRKTC